LVSAFVIRYTVGVRHCFFVISDNDFQLYVLKRKLVMNETEQFDRAGIRHVRATYLNPRRFAGELWMTGLHFAIEQK
jgi:hypothetical protein